MAIEKGHEPRNPGEQSASDRLPLPGLPRDREATFALLGIFVAAFVPLAIEIARLFFSPSPSTGVVGLMAAFCLLALLINQYYLVRLTSAYVRRLDLLYARLQRAGDYKEKAHKVNAAVSNAFNELAKSRSRFDDFILGILSDVPPH